MLKAPILRPLTVHVHKAMQTSRTMLNPNGCICGVLEVLSVRGCMWQRIYIRLAMSVLSNAAYTYMHDGKTIDIRVYAYLENDHF